VLTGLLADGCVVTFPRFGTFATTDRPAQQARDIRTGQRITLPAHRQVTFRAGEDLRQALRDNDGSVAK
jgi:DNA-binding protein HU-beta